MAGQVLLNLPSAGGLHTIFAVGSGMWTTTSSPYLARQAPLGSVLFLSTSSAVRSQLTSVWLLSPVFTYLQPAGRPFGDDQVPSGKPRSVTEPLALDGCAGTRPSASCWS